MEKSSANRQQNKVNLTFDFRLVAAILALVILAMFALWRPWEDTGANARTIEVTGEATIKAAPDEFVFYPSYEFKNADRNAALGELTKKSGEIVAKLKTIGVSDKGIKTNADGYDYPLYRDGASTPTYTLRLTVTVNDKDLAQKVQDYLVGTAPSGSVSPQPAFSDAKRKELESKARDEATKDARSKAEQSAKNLGFRLGSVKAVSDGSGFGDVVPLRGIGANDAMSAEAQKLTIQPGENDLTYAVSVTYFVR